MEIRVKDVTKIIKHSMILDDVSLELHSGTIYGLQGPNGSGKTMFMRLIAGLIRPTTGNVQVDNAIIGQDIDFPSSMGLLIENPAFLPQYTGYQNLALLASLKGVASKEDICKAMCEVGLAPDEKKTYKKYSLGMKQRLGIAAAIMERPDLIILDEPTNALDDEGASRICKLIQRERDRGAIVLMSCHDEKIMDAIADVIYTVNSGQIREKVTS